MVDSINRRESLVTSATTVAPTDCLTIFRVVHTNGKVYDQFLSLGEAEHYRDAYHSTQDDEPLRIVPAIFCLQ